MGVIEIVLIIIGSIILVLSFVLPANKNEDAVNQVPKIDEGMIRELIEKEVKDARNHINDIVDETITYSMEKTERAMERLTNEKIMAVNEYSEQVLGTINKNHQEVMFLYDMLNDKHDNLVNTVSEASRKAQEIKQTVQDVEITVKEAKDSCADKQEKKPRRTKTQGKSDNEIFTAGETASQEQDTENKKAKSQRTTRGRKRGAAADNAETDNAAAQDIESSKGLADSISAAFAEDNFVPIAPERVEVVNGMIQEASLYAEDEQQPEEEKSYNNNEKILRLHKLGKSKTAIAKELGLGVGEVKLVIDLFEQA